MKKFLICIFVFFWCIKQLYAPENLRIENSKSEQNNKVVQQKNVPLPIEVPLGAKAYIEKIQSNQLNPVVKTKEVVHFQTEQKFGTITEHSYPELGLNIEYLVHDNESLKPTIKLTDKSGSEEIIQIGRVRKPILTGSTFLDDSYTITKLDNGKIKSQTFHSDGTEMLSSKLYNFVKSSEQIALKLIDQTIGELKQVLKMPLSKEQNYEIEKIGFDLIEEASTQLGILLSYQEKKNVVNVLMKDANYLNESSFVNWVAFLFCRMIEFGLYISEGCVAKVVINLKENSVIVNSIDKNGLTSQAIIGENFYKITYFDVQGKNKVKEILEDYDKEENLVKNKVSYYDNAGKLASSIQYDYADETTITLSDLKLNNQIKIKFQDDFKLNLSYKQNNVIIESALYLDLVKNQEKDNVKIDNIVDQRTEDIFLEQLGLMKGSVLEELFFKLDIYNDFKKVLFEKINSIKKSYELLDVSPFSDKSAVDKAYRKKALKYHPDKNKSPDAQEKFKELSTAKEIIDNYNENEAGIDKLYYEYEPKKIKNS